MINPEQITIPGKAVEAAAKKEYELACARGSNTWPKWEVLPTHRQELWLNDARAMITAALNAWPGVEVEIIPDGTEQIILPLTQENNNGSD